MPQLAKGIALLLLLSAFAPMAGAAEVQDPIYPFFFHDNGSMDRSQQPDPGDVWVERESAPFRSVSTPIPLGFQVAKSGSFVVTLSERTALAAGIHTTQVHVQMLLPGVNATGNATQGDAVVTLASRTFHVILPSPAAAAPSPLAGPLDPLLRNVSETLSAFGQGVNATRAHDVAFGPRGVCPAGSANAACMILNGDVGYAGIRPCHKESPWSLYSTNPIVWNTLTDQGVCGRHSARNETRIAAEAADAALPDGPRLPDMPMTPGGNASQPPTEGWRVLRLNLREGLDLPQNATHVFLPAGARLQVLVILDAPGDASAPASVFQYDSPRAPSRLDVRGWMGPRPESVVSREGFETGAANWTLTGLWHVSSACLGSPTSLRSLQFNRDDTCTYRTDGADNRTSLRSVGNASTVVSLAGVERSATLRFLHAFQVEKVNASFDVMRVSLSCDGDAWQTLRQWDSRNGTQPWHDEALNVSRCLGGDAHIRFSFDSIDGAFNDHAGWAIDDVVVTAT